MKKLKKGERDITTFEFLQALNQVFDMECEIGINLNNETHLIIREQERIKKRLRKRKDS